MNSEAKMSFPALLQCVTKKTNGCVSVNIVGNYSVGFTTVTVK